MLGNVSNAGNPVINEPLRPNWRSSSPVEGSPNADNGNTGARGVRAVPACWGAALSGGLGE